MKVVALTRSHPAELDVPDELPSEWRVPILPRFSYWIHGDNPYPSGPPETIEMKLRVFRLQWWSFRGENVPDEWKFRPGLRYVAGREHFLIKVPIYVEQP